MGSRWVAFQRDVAVGLPDVQKITRTVALYQINLAFASNSCPFRLAYQTESTCLHKTATTVLVISTALSKTCLYIARID